MTVTIHTGDCLDILRKLDGESVHTVVTSPPYYGLRDYNTGEWIGGDSSCEHKVGEIRTGLGMKELSEKYRGGGKKAAKEKPIYATRECPHCGAIREDKQIGLEDTPEEFVSRLVEVFREVRRVLREDGTVWLNIGDSYASRAGGYDQRGSLGLYSAVSARAKQATIPGSTRNPPPGYKPKDLIGIPWMLAFALRADGWYLRQDIIWAKPNPMPESVTDRCTKSHEYIFLLSKSLKYYFAAEEIMEKSTSRDETVRDRDSGKMNSTPGRTRMGGLVTNNYETRNKRSVWTVGTKGYDEAHFATYPPDLIEPCIKAGCPKDGVILDPFFGAGTTALVADRNQRHCIGIELNPEYVQLAKKRLEQDMGMFGKLEVV